MSLIKDSKELPRASQLGGPRHSHDVGGLLYIRMKALSAKDGFFQEVNVDCDDV